MAGKKVDEDDSRCQERGEVGKEGCNQTEGDSPPSKTSPPAAAYNYPAMNAMFNPTFTGRVYEGPDIHSSSNGSGLQLKTDRKQNHEGKRLICFQTARKTEVQHF